LSPDYSKYYLCIADVKTALFPSTLSFIIGKSEILKEYINENIRSVPDWLFGKGKYARKGHARKLGARIQRLPAICRQLSKTIKITSPACVVRLINDQDDKKMAR